MGKINVLVIPSDRSGVGAFRSIKPHLKLQELYPDDFFVELDFSPPMDDEAFWDDYQIVHFHRMIGNDYERSRQLIRKLRSKGIIVIGDIDDYWLPTSDHPMYPIILHDKMHEKILGTLKEVDHITTTTEIFADHMRKFHKSVVVFPNAIDPMEKQFRGITTEDDKMRFGWLGGSSHINDLRLLDGTVSLLAPNIDKFKMVLCGFDTRGEITELNPATGEKFRRPIKPEETVWVKYEEIFTNKYKTLSQPYINELRKFVSGDIKGFEDEPYVRIWTKPVTSYAENYTKFDVLVAPLKNHVFNRMKSQLKVIEAGFYKKAIIASDVGPYTIDLKHSLKNGMFTDGNALLVDENRNHKDWAKYMKKLIENPEWAIELGERLHETVKDKYHIDTVTKNRAEFYKSIIK